jgi:hypothetical protein
VPCLQLLWTQVVDSLQERIMDGGYIWNDGSK